MKQTTVRIGREIVAIGFWSYVAIKLFVFDLDVYTLEHFGPELTWILEYKLVAVMAIIGITWLALGHRAFFLSIGYVLGYPLVLLFWKLPKHAMRRWPIFLLFSPLIYSAVTTARSTFVLYTVGIICCLLISSYHDSLVLVGAMVGLAFFGAIHLFRSVRRAHAMRVFYQLAKFAREFRIAVESGRMEGRGDSPSLVNTETGPAADTAYLNLYTYHVFASLIAERVHDVIQRRVFDLYLIGSWIYTVVLTALVYAFEYWGLYRIDAASFKVMSGATFWDFAGFSLGMLTSKSLSHIEPAKRVSTLVCYSEFACSGLILVILVFLILTAARQAFREDAIEFIEELRRAGVAVEKRLSDAYRLTVVEVETAVAAKNAKMVNMLRKARGLPELPPPPMAAVPVSEPIPNRD